MHGSAPLRPRPRRSGRAEIPKRKPTREQLNEAIAIWERDVMSTVPRTRGQHMMPEEIRSEHGEKFFTILDEVIKRGARGGGSRHK